MTEIHNERDLPAPHPQPLFDGTYIKGMLAYIRLKSDPHLLIGSMSGVVYTRADGARWSHPAYKVIRESHGGVTIDPCMAWFDSEIYAYNAERVA